MIPNHQQLLLSMTAADPEFLAGAFATTFTRGASGEGERGTFTYFQGGFWDIRLQGSARFVLAPWGSRVVEPDGSSEDGPAMLNPGRRPPWSLVLPRYSTFLGRQDDDWQLDAGEKIEEADGSLRARLTSLEDPRYTGEILVDAEKHFIVRVDLGHMVQSLSALRDHPTAEDMAVLEGIRATVKEFELS